MFKTIDKDNMAEIVEKKSKFIANIFYIESVEQAEEIIKNTKRKYYDARHNCFAYSVYTENGNIERFSDDGEPSGTAGAPMLNILTTQGLSNVLVIVTRYFGGILLGTGGLVRAYSEALKMVLSISKIVEKDLGLIYSFTVKYSDIEKIKYFFKQENIKIIDIKYDENVELMFEIKKEKCRNILNRLPELPFVVLKSTVIQEAYIELSKNVE